MITRPLLVVNETTVEVARMSRGTAVGTNFACSIRPLLSVNSMVAEKIFFSINLEFCQPSRTAYL